MGWPQTVSGVLLVVVLLSVSLFYGWRQLRALRALRHTRGAILPAEEASHDRRQAWRRLVSSGLLFVLAVLLSGALLYLESPTQYLADLDVPRVSDYTREQRLLIGVWVGWWIAFLLVLLAVVLLAALDWLATRRWGLRQHRKLQADRRAMLQRQLSRLREERDGAG